MALIQLKAKVNNTKIPIIAIQAPKSASGLNPKSNPVTTITTVEIAFLNTSEITWPLSTAMLLIGKLLKRSTIPRCKSFATAIEVVVEPNASVCTMIPAIKKSMYEISSGSANPTALNTAVNNTKNIIG